LTRRLTKTESVMPNETTAELNSVERQNQILQLLISLPIGDAIGAAASFLLHCAYNHRDVFRRVMNERIVREGFSRISILAVFNNRAGRE
jgi:hypothetical protein